MTRKPWQQLTLGALAGAVVTAILAGSLFVFGPLSGLRDLEPGKLVILSGEDELGQRQQLVDVWNDLNPKNRAVIVPLPKSADDQYAVMTTSAADIDIFNLDVTWTARFATPPSGPPLILPIDERRLVQNADKSFLANPLKTCRHRGKLWALPFNTDAGLLYYRTDLNLGSASEPPFSWDKIKTATQIGLARTRSFKAGYTSQLNRYEGLTVNLLETLWSIGGDIAVDEQGGVTFDRDKLDEAVRLLTPRRDGERGLVLPESVNFEEDNSRAAFRDGQTMFMRNWPVAHRRMSAGEQTTTTPAPRADGFRFDVAKLPGDSVLGGQNLAISARTEQPRAAQALIEFLTGEGSQRLLFDKGGFAATRASVYENEEIKAKYSYLPRLREAVEGARLRPVSANYVPFSQRLSERVHDVLAGPSTALPDDLAEQLTAALRGQ